MPINGTKASTASEIRFIPLPYSSKESEASALRLILTVRPEWGSGGGKVEFTQFTEGITNTLLKVVQKRVGQTEEETDRDAILLRAYGQGTEVFIDRERERAAHFLLSTFGLAPALLARFPNGLLYRFVHGQVCSAQELSYEPVWRGVARRLGQWHAVVPLLLGRSPVSKSMLYYDSGWSSKELCLDIVDADMITPGKPMPNIWTVMSTWIRALPDGTAPQVGTWKLGNELLKLVQELGDIPGIGRDGLVFGHCDLLCGNVVRINPSASIGNSKSVIESVAFIDYEYTTAAPAAFDLANHFAEWGGLNCDYMMLPTKSTRRAFLKEYLQSYTTHLEASSSCAGATSSTTSLSNALPSFTWSPTLEIELDSLCASVDRFRGLPGFFWGIWALIQATLSEIDFDYAAYAELRFAEYKDWRAEVDGSRVREGRERGPREQRWNQE